ncbi:MAG: response regulator receiver [Elusimicrobia bacterium]|nr:MAG: response regulator receiver [Elusimicrobiota bacterium]KAF0156741.1 MAG: response regulator receiver [Elusimicrobiota bacterium]
MGETAGLVLVVTMGKELPEELRPSMSGRGLELAIVPTLNYAADRLAKGDCLAIVVDYAKVSLVEREAFLALHKQYPTVHFFSLETMASNSPEHPAPLRRLGWPIPNGFADQMRAIDRQIVLLAEQVLFVTGAVQTALQSAGVKPVSLESTNDLASFIAEQNEARIASSQRKKPKSLWSKLSGGAEETPAASQFLGNVVVAQFNGTQEDAEALDAEIRGAAPEAVCYLVSGTDTARYALQFLREGRPVSLMREHAGRIAGVLAELTGGGADTRLKEREKERILLLDNFKPALTMLGQALLGAGYEVTASMDGGEALNLCKKGSFHLAVIGTAISFAEHSGAELAQKLRERDPDLRIIFMVDQYPLKAALQGVSQVVELGLDDALLKPVEPSRLIFSVQKALEARFLKLENARLLKETQAQKEQLELVNGFQKKFFATVAHDVKSPLTAILGYSEVLTGKLKALPGEQRYAANIQTSARTLNVLISDLVDLAAMESGKLRVEIGTLNLLNVINDVYARVEIAAQKRQLKMIKEVPASLPPLAGDDARVGQVVQNLCTNAIQYTKEGGQITIRAELKSDRVEVSVIDTGIGISKEDLPRVWERFFQTKEAQGMRKAGFGLGLKIAREIVQRHGGEMGIESELGVGSRFFFHIPVKEGGAPPPAPAAAQKTPEPALRPEQAPAPVPAAPVPPPTILPTHIAPAPLPPEIPSSAPLSPVPPPAPAPEPAPAPPPGGMPLPPVPRKRKP